jgi:hypothetical protein
VSQMWPDHSTSILPFNHLMVQQTSISTLPWMNTSGLDIWKHMKYLCCSQKTCSLVKLANEHKEHEKEEKKIAQRM